MALQDRNQDLFQKVEHQVGKATPQLWHSYATFPSGTKHTPEHTQMVEAIAGDLLPDDLLQTLVDDEIAFLILACHYHDMGMVGTEDDNLTAETRDRVRREHAVSIGDRILQHWQAMGFPNETTAAVLAEICKGHRPKRVDGVATWENLPEHRIVGPGRGVRVRLVAAIVYAADELHIGEDRAPRREEEFNKIVNAQSLQHWRCHQAVQGPVMRNGEMCFEGSVGTPLFETALRSSLKKAFQAIKELEAELQRADIAESPAGIRFCWHRAKMWELLCALVLKDLKPRSLDEIATEIESLHARQIAESEDLSPFCEEDVSTSNLRTEIEESISKLVTREFLIRDGDNSSYNLDGLPRSTDFFFQIAKHADEIDNLFANREPPQHEYLLYQSDFGRRYVRDQLHPRLHRDYHIDVVEMPNVQHLKRAIESSPTASRIAQLLSVPPSVLVQTDLLEFASIAGTCADLINDPELILNTEYRHAVTQLFNASTERLPKFLLFIEELAIIKKLTFEQVLDASSVSDAEKEQYQASSEESFNVTQTFPATRPDWSLGYLMLARKRAEVSITIQNTQVAPIEIRRKGDDTESEVHQPEMPVAVTIGPGKPRPAAANSFRASMSLDKQKNKLSISASRLSANDTGKHILFQFSPKEVGQASCQLSVIITELTVGDIITFRDANQLFEQGELTTEVTVRGKRLIPIDDLNVGGAGANLFGELVEGLAEVDSTIPFPLYVDNEYIDRLLACDQSKLQCEIESIYDERKASRLTLTTIFLRHTNHVGEEYYEEYLGLQPPNFGFKAPKTVGKGISQDEIDKQWDAGVDFRFEMSFREDIYDLSQSLRDWVADTDQPFPFQFDNDLRFHYCKTRMIICFDAVIDRKWYLERRVIFRFRPASKAEQYGLEMEYWNSQGDANRAELLRELLEHAIAIEPITSRGLTKRVTKLLNGAGVTTFGDLSRMDRRTLQAIRGIGPKAIEDIERLLSSRGLQLPE